MLLTLSGHLSAHLPKCVKVQSKNSSQRSLFCIRHKKHNQKQLQTPTLTPYTYIHVHPNKYFPFLKADQHRLRTWLEMHNTQTGMQRAQRWELISA